MDGDTIGKYKHALGHCSNQYCMELSNSTQSEPIDIVRVWPRDKKIWKLLIRSQMEQVLRPIEGHHPENNISIKTQQNLKNGKQWRSHKVWKPNGSTAFWAES